jgi:hypothetical protein
VSAVASRCADDFRCNRRSRLGAVAEQLGIPDAVGCGRSHVLGSLRVIAHRVGGSLAQAMANFPSTRFWMAAKAVWPAMRAVPVTERYPAWI